MVSFTRTPPTVDHDADGEGLSGGRLQLLPAIIALRAGIATDSESGWCPHSVLIQRAWGDHRGHLTNGLQ